MNDSLRQPAAQDHLVSPTVTGRRGELPAAVVRGQTIDTILVLEDLAPAVRGDHVASPCVLHAVGLAVVAIAGLHAAFWSDPRIDDYPHASMPQAIPQAAARIGEATRTSAEVTQTLPFARDSPIIRLSEELMHTVLG
ncbi:hypothetical protein [Nocardia pseudovaccinii]|uniref:hypothetical protein n=1 Tax=Nocardia pseudovaccinii TaxID=189540 RepID=UPI0007A50525|nr:hypothetical protein [Nocardia pseudovaccinii]